ncbi:hypothetical protein CU098_003546 [Rhizopus stolonifer]|uniref:Uncharacterized protein n=1 Tax=Rhizopus stolonifer TaxID=4846 RepID=A0A367IRR8_RHIST|nr:hypothetical protein CU098_003546 [Rhizopus stolonifer]
MDDSAMKLAKLESLLHSQHQEAGAKQVSWIQKIEELKCHNQRLEEGLQQHEKESKGIQEDGDRKIPTIRKLDEQRLVKEQMCKLETNNKVLRQKLSVTEHTVNQLKSHTKELKEFYEQETAQLHARIRKLEGKTASSGDLIYTVEELIAMTENLKEDKKALTLKISKLESRQKTLEDSLSLSQKNEEYFKKSLKRTLGEIANIEKALKRLNELLRENQ